MLIHPLTAPLIQSILEAGLSGSDFVIPLPGSGISALGSMVIVAGGLTITLRFSASPPVVGASLV